MVKSRLKSGVVQKSLSAVEAGEKTLDSLRPVVDEKTLGKIVKSKPRTAKGRKVLRLREPQLAELTKTLLLLKGNSCSARGQEILKDLMMVRKPHSILLGRRKQTRLLEPMRQPSDFEFLGEKNQASLFSLISTTKKHPLRLFCGRLFNWKIYDLHEFDIVDYVSLNKQLHNLPVEGSKPLVLFQGSLWESSPQLEMAKNCLADLLGGIRADKLYLDKFDRAFTCVIYEKKNELGATDILITINHWKVALKKRSKEDRESSVSDPLPEAKVQLLPSVELEFIGPRLTLKTTNTPSIIPSKDQVKSAMRIPSEEFVKGTSSKKTVTNALRQTRQTVHVQKESTTKLRLRHGKGSTNTH